MIAELIPHHAEQQQNGQDDDKDDAGQIRRQAVANDAARKAEDRKQNQDDQKDVESCEHIEFSFRYLRLPAVAS